MSEERVVPKPLKQRRMGRRAFWLWLIALGVLGGALHYVFTQLLPQVTLPSEIAVPDAIPYGPWSFALTPELKVALLAAVPTLVLLALPNIIIDVRRRHDRGGSGIFAVLFTLLLLAGTALLFVPSVPRDMLGWAYAGLAVYGLLLVLNLGFLPGKPGPNKYGPDRHAHRTLEAASAPVQTVTAQHGTPATPGSTSFDDEKQTPRARDLALDARVPRSRFIGHTVGTLVFFAAVGGILYLLGTLLLPRIVPALFVPGSPQQGIGLMVVMAVVAIVAVFILAFIIDLAIRRRHDRGARGFDVPLVILMLAGVAALHVLKLIPAPFEVAGPALLGLLGLYLLVVLAILPGTRGPNRYGPPPYHHV